MNPSNEGNDNNKQDIKHESIDKHIDKHVDEQQTKDNMLNQEGNVTALESPNNSNISSEELIIQPLEEEVISDELAERLEKLSGWNPKTSLGKAVKSKQIINIDDILNKGKPILEPEIVEALLPLKAELLLIGQAKGKFGGGKRRAFRSTQKKTSEGNKPKFEAMIVIGDEVSHVGIGYGKSKDTLPAREKALRNAKLSVFKVVKGCGSWECDCKTPHSIPFRVSGKSGSVIVDILPAPRGKGVIAESEIRKILQLAGIKDAWVNTKGQTKNKVNVIKATEKALRKLSLIKIKSEHLEQLSIV